MKRWRGLVALVSDAVEHGSRAVEKVHKGISEKPFAVLEAIPPIRLPVKAVRLVHDAVAATTYTSIRVVNKAVSTSIEVAMDAVEAREAASRDPEAPPNA